MGTASSYPSDFRLAMDDSPTESYEMSKVLLARAAFDGTLQLLTSGWEHALGYGRAELEGKTLRQLMWSDQRSAAAAVAAILDRLSAGPVDLRMRCRNGLAKCFRLHRRYDKHEHVMYIVAEETSGNAPGVRRRTEERRSAVRQASPRAAS